MGRASGLSEELHIGLVERQSPCAESIAREASLNEKNTKQRKATQSNAK
jgi:hypothetical protein